MQNIVMGEMLMRIKDLQFLVEVAKTKSITTAAKNMHISQQGLSQIIGKIEKSLSVPLFIRFRQGVSLTEAGEKAIEIFKEILLKYEELLHELEVYTQYKNSSLSGDLAIYSTFHVGTTILPKALKLFKTKHPNVNLIINEKPPHEIVDIIKTDNTALGLINMPESYYCNPQKLSRFMKHKLCFKKIFQDKLIACVSKSSPLAKKEYITAEELIKYPLAFYNTEQYMEIISLLFQGIGEPTVLLKTLNAELYRKVIIDGLAIGFATFFEINQHQIFKENVVTIPIQLTLIYGWVYSFDHSMSPVALEFVKCLEMSLK